MPSLWSSLADLRVRIDDYAIERREQAVSSEFTRVTTTVVLHGDGETGEGEDVTYTAADHDDFPDGEMLAGTWTLHDYSVRLDELELFSAEPQMAASRDYRRWAFESAALDLALRQAGRVVRGRARARVPAGAVRRVDTGRHRAVPRALSGARVQARRRGGLGSRADGAARRHRSRARPRPEGVLPQHARRPRADPRSTASSPSASRTS